LDRVLFIPCAQPPHKASETLVAAEHRLAMLRAAVANNPRFAVNTIELERSGPSFTIETLKALGKTHPDTRFYFILGTDSLLELHQWRAVGELLELCEFVTMLRPGFPVEHLAEERLNLPPPWPARLLKNLFPGHAADISSTDIRRRVAAGRSIRYLVPDAVAGYIAAQGLYQA
jgi:nicotinate-nucleotide adenylyltransferase